MDCNYCHQLLSKRVADELTRFEFESLDSHLAQCEECSVRAREMETLAQDLQRLGAEIEQVRASFTFSPDEGVEFKHCPFSWMRLAAQVSFAAAALFAIAVFLPEQPDDPPGMSTPLVEAKTEPQPITGSRRFRTPVVAVDTTPPPPTRVASRRQFHRSPSFARPGSSRSASALQIRTPSMTMGFAKRRYENVRKLDHRKDDRSDGFIAPDDHHGLGRVKSELKPA